MSYTFTITGNTATIDQHIHPAVCLGPGTWEICLLNFDTFNSIPNIDAHTVIYFGSNSSQLKKVVLPIGSYEISEITDFINNQLGEKDVFQLVANRNTLQTKLFSKFDISMPESLANLLGFYKRKFEGGIWHKADRTPNILPVTTIRISCNIAQGAFLNGRKTNVIHELPINVPSGFRLLDRPTIPIYYNINTKEITTISISLTDQLGKAINNRGENFSIQLHLKKGSQ